MKKRIIKIFVIFAFGILFLLGLTQSVFSDYVSNLREQRANLQSQLDASNAQIEIIQSDVSELVNQITELNEQITSQEIEIELLQQQKEDLEKTIVETEENLEIATEEFEKQKKQLEERLVASYKAGETTYLDVLLQSSSLSEFISNYYMISELVSADEKMLERISEQKEQLEFAKLELKRQKKELNTTVEESENKAVSLENMRVISNSYIAQLSAEEAEYTNSIVERQTEIKKVEAEILTAARMNIGYDYVGGEMAWPVPGYTLITSPYGMRTHPITGVYKLHTGTDISAPMGTDFIAANDGVVAKAEYNYAYGNMVMINHGGGVSTLYAHGSQILVEVGQSVTRGEPVVGSTGYSTGPHAHFEVRINGQYTDPMPYITK